MRVGAAPVFRAPTCGTEVGILEGEYVIKKAPLELGSRFIQPATLLVERRVHRVERLFTIEYLAKCKCLSAWASLWYGRLYSRFSILPSFPTAGPVT